MNEVPINCERNYVPIKFLEIYQKQKDEFF